ncbi:germination protein [Clostridia bacterium]|nr:germination protein [Clostridia bacterium]
MIYTVKKGDSLYSIGRAHGLSYVQIAKDNELSADDELVVGQTIFLNDGQEEKLGEIIVNGYAFPNITQNVLDRTSPELTYLSIFSYEASASSPFLKPINDDTVIKDALSFGVFPALTITNIGKSGGFEAEVAHAIISDEKASRNVLGAAVKIMDEKGYHALNIDFEYLYPEDRENYNSFILLAEEMVHATANRVLMTALAPKYNANQQGALYSAHDYNFHGRHVDYVILMTYEWGYAYSEPMSVAPVGEVKRVLDYAVTEIPSEKILMGIPNYGYNWHIPYSQGEAAAAVGNYDAVRIARQNGAEIEYDEKAQTPHFTYYDISGKEERLVYFEDARSIQAKLSLVYDYNLGGVSYWTINRYFPQNWLVLDAMYDTEKAPRPRI